MTEVCDDDDVVVGAALLEPWVGIDNAVGNQGMLRWRDMVM